MTTGNQDPGHKLLGLIDREHQLLHELLTFMDTEKSELLAGHSVEQILIDKQNLLTGLEEATQARLQMLREHNFSADRGGVLACIEGQTDCPGLVASYAAFEATAVECRNRNNNLAHVARRREGFLGRVQTALRADGEVGLPTYSANGDYLSDNNVHLLGSA